MLEAVIHTFNSPKAFLLHLIFRFGNLCNTRRMWLISDVGENSLIWGAALDDGLHFRFWLVLLFLHRKYLRISFLTLSSRLFCFVVLVLSISFKFSTLSLSNFFMKLFCSRISFSSSCRYPILKSNLVEKIALSRGKERVTYGSTSLQ